MGKRNTPSLIDVAKEFGTDEQCIAYLEALRWPEGVHCVNCYGDNISKFVVPASETIRKRKNAKTGVVEIKKSHVPARHLYQCLNPECKQQFSATAGTIFHDTHLPLSTWMMAVALVVNAKKGLSAKQLERDLHVSYPTAWYLYHRIRESMKDSAPAIFSGTVEADATFLGGKYDKRRKRARYHDKQAIFGLIQRGANGEHSKVYATPIAREIKLEVLPIIEQRVAPDAMLYTDEHGAYRALGKTRRHQIVIHSTGNYVQGDCHSNSVENFWSLFKRGLIGSYHQISVKHLVRYLSEFTFRFNNREAEDLFAMVMLNLVIGKALTRAALTARQNPPEDRDDWEQKPF